MDKNQGSLFPDFLLLIICSVTGIMYGWIPAMQNAGQIQSMTNP